MLLGIGATRLSLRCSLETVETVANATALSRGPFPEKGCPDGAVLPCRPNITRAIKTTTAIGNVLGKRFRKLGMVVVYLLDHRVVDFCIGELMLCLANTGKRWELLALTQYRKNCPIGTS